MSTTDAVFSDRPAGATPAGSPVTFGTIADAIRNMKPRELPESAFADVLTMMEYMQGELVARHDAQEKEATRLADLRADLDSREKALAIRQRTVTMVEQVRAAPRGILGVLSRAPRG